MATKPQILTHSLLSAQIYNRRWSVNIWHIGAQFSAPDIFLHNLRDLADRSFLSILGTLLVILPLNRFEHPVRAIGWFRMGSPF